MQALEKNLIDSSWVTIILVVLLALIAVLKIIDSERLKGYVFALFNKGFIESEIEEDTSFLDAFYNTLFLFSTTTLSLIVHAFLSERSFGFKNGFSSFFYIFVTVVSYFLVKWILEILLSRLFLIKNTVRFYFVSKFSYLYSISFLLFILFVITTYSSLNSSILFYATAILFLIRLVFHITNNKKLIFSQLFYFILYICAFEIAPLFILFKLML
ncbi:DUF4271 domain-containing protein [Polaribacter batillariae]|uniref:DUF4271 domain-containing protein n=1 Tax=Polaribacter batillariae TaxID=2808900 RepID=A0ABX7SQP5_9FLAO|nr:DUF4271 domain-containing protein [Polaribacter batillariae]QTD36545.1 DUF4271 domain-containing protein [Polaribacter batillariae]